MGIAVGVAKRGAFADLNIVPLIDILLVLLVIFMIIPHQQTVEIPQPGPPEPTLRPEVIVVEALGDDSLQINRQPVKWEGLRGRLEEIFSRGNNHTAFIRGDGALEFQVVARVIDIMRTSGALTVGLMTPGLDRATQVD